MKQSVQVSILGQQFHLRSDSDPEQVRQVADFVEKQVGDILASGRVADSLQAAVLALLNVSARYLQTIGSEEAGDSVAEARLRSLAERLETVLDDRSGALHKEG